MTYNANFALQIGTSILEAMEQVATIDVPEGFDVDNIALKFSFEDERIPDALHGNWKVTIERVFSDAT